MRSNRRRHENLLPLASLATWLVIIGFACASALYYVYCKNQLIKRGDEIRALETELANRKIANEAAATHIASLSAPAALHARREMLAKFTPITQDHLVSVPAQAAELRKVSIDKP